MDESKWVEYHLRGPQPVGAGPASAEGHRLRSTYCVPGPHEQGGCHPGYFCALRKQFLGVVLAGSVFHTRCEVASRMPTHGCSQISSNGAFLTTTPILCHTRTSWKLPREQQVASPSHPSQPSGYNQSYYLTEPQLLQLKREMIVPNSALPSPDLVPSGSSYRTGIAFLHGSQT